MMSPIRALCCAALAFGLVGCSDGGTPSDPGSTDGQGLFGSFFGSGGAGGEREDAAAQPGVDCDADCEPGWSSSWPVCEDPHAAPAGALAACQSFCQKVAGCLDAPEQVTACRVECVSHVGGMELALIQQIFGCFTAADCEDITGWHGGGPVTSEPTEPVEPPRADAGSDREIPPRDEREPGNDEPDGVWEAWEPGPIELCLDGVYDGLMHATLGPAKANACQAIVDTILGCEVHSGGSTGSAPPRVPDPAPEYGDDGDGSDEDDWRDDGPWWEPTEDELLAQCAMMANLLDQGVLDRLAGCANASTCEAAEACFEAEMACLPMMLSVVDGIGADGGSGTIEPIPVDDAPAVPGGEVPGGQ